MTLPPPSSDIAAPAADGAPAGAVPEAAPPPLPAPPDEAAALRAEVARLQERLDLVQQFCQAGIFERDPRTLEGHWDAQMYRVFGLPVAPAGSPAPPYHEVAAMMFQEDRVRGGFRSTLDRAGVHADRVRLLRPDGSVRHIHSQWKVFHDADGQAVRVLGVNTDDTEVFELARRTEELREELDLVLRLGQIGLWRYDLASGRVHFDERACRQLGLTYDPKGITVEHSRSLIHPDDLPGVNASAEQTLRTGAPTDMTLRYRRPDGGWAHMLSRRMLQRDVSGRPVAFVGVLLDETEGVERSRQALELAQRLEAAAEAARIGLWSARRGDPRPDWNRRMFELFGLDASQPSLPLGEWVRRCVHPEDRDRVATQVTAWVRDAAGPIDVGCRIVRPSDGAVRWLELRGNADASRPLAERRFEGVAIDVTEQQETLQRLRESVERIALTASAVGLGSWELDVARDLGVWDEGMFRLRGVDSAARAISREEIASYLHPDDRHQVMDDQSRLRRGGETWRTTFRVVWPDGSVRWLASRSAPIIDAGGRVVRRIGLNWDVTESVLAEQAMRERELALAESRTKSRFMSHVSHELRTPLNAVLGFTQLLRDPRAAPSPAVREGWLAQIEAAGQHLLALIEDVLTLSRVEAGEMRLAPQPVALAELVRSTLPLVERDARARRVELVAEEPLAGVAVADPVRLRQVLLNLLSNAVKYNRLGGLVRVSVEERATEVVLGVADTGRGIEPQQMGRVFEPFDRLGAEASEIPGTGIGLAISKALVEQMGGRIDVQSRPGIGSLFAVALPRSAESPAAAGAVELAADRAAAADGVDEQRADGHSRSGALPTVAAIPTAATAASPRARILYIEDNPVNALLMRELMASQEGVELEVVADGRDGLRRAREWRPELILLDMQLPDLHGLAVLEALRADPATATIRCVALSANAMPPDIAAARAAGAVEYWTKPIQFAPFLASLARLLGRG
jgi:PAS domain S-box-containing protein